MKKSIELYTLKPLYPGIDEFDQLNKILQIVGTPEFNEWPEGYALVQKLNIRLPNYNKSNLKQYVPNANDDAIDFMDFIFQLNPEKRPSCNELLRHPYFTEMQRPKKIIIMMVIIVIIIIYMERIILIIIREVLRMKEEIIIEKVFLLLMLLLMALGEIIIIGKEIVKIIFLKLILIEMKEIIITIISIRLEILIK